VTDARLHSTKPIDDEIPFEDASGLPLEEAPADEDALVTPAAAERERTMPDRDVDPAKPPSDDVDPDR
jgi:hypothetical protein